jgi:diguanylate cyclase (GGDEF)-like protein
MHTQTKEALKQNIRPILIGPHWEHFLPGEGQERDTVSALQQAETVIRAQDERIRLLESQALSDELTGLTNRRGFNIAFERELSLARRDTASCGVLVMADLDGFKQINDQYGHQAGDAYLHAVAQVLQECVRSSDVVARLGGDEFAILFTHMDQRTGAKRLAKLEQVFNNRSTLWNGKRLTLRASFGSAPYAGSDNAETILQAADVRLYAHKARNKILSAAEQ